MPSAMKITASFSSLMQQNFQSLISSKLNSIFKQALSWQQSCFALFIFQNRIFSSLKLNYGDVRQKEF